MLDRDAGGPISAPGRGLVAGDGTTTLITDLPYGPEAAEVARGAVALALRHKRNPAFVYNSMSDGELDEGATWEAAMGAAHHGLANLICLVDINNQQADGPSGKVLGFEPLADVRPGTAVVLGLLTTKSPRLEYESDVLTRIKEASRFKPLADLALSTQCGFASVPVENPLTPQEQRAKLGLVVRLARQAWSG